MQNNSLPDCTKNKKYDTMADMVIEKTLRIEERT